MSWKEGWKEFKDMPIVILGQGDYERAWPKSHSKGKQKQDKGVRPCPGCGSPEGDCENQSCVREPFG